jgi:hypothetical protein
VPALLVKAAELHVRADLGVVDAAEHDLTSDALAGLPASLRTRRGPRYSVQLGMMTGAVGCVIRRTGPRRPVSG